MISETTLEDYFSQFRKNITGNQQMFESPFGKKQIIYADWTASGRAYQPIEACIQKEIMPFLANTHTETTVTGTLMSKAYEEAKVIIKKHVGAGSDDVLIFCGIGMTSVVNKLQRILGLRMPERMEDYMKKNLQDVDGLNGNMTNGNKLPHNHFSIDEILRPIVFVTHMEHNSNHISWLETIATAEIIRADENGNVDLANFKNLLEQNQHRKNKIAAITACSNAQIIFYRFSKMKNVEVLESRNKKRLGVISFIVTGAHYDLIVKMLNDRFGIQTRGDCSCAGTYGHMLLQVNKTKSYVILNGIRSGNLLCKPGWVRLSVHPT